MEPYYDEDGITIYHGDCVDVLPQLSPVDIVVTDPPYNVGFEYDGNVNDCLSDSEWEHWAKDWFFPCRELSKTVLITGQTLVPRFARLEPWKWLLMWYKPAAMGRSPVGFCSCEPIAMWGSGSSAGLTDVIVAPLKPSKEAGSHPCPKPLEWAAGQLVRFPKAESVLDPFMGSGTVLVAGKKQGLKCVGIEQSEKYCEIAVNRLRQKVLTFS